MNLQTELFAVVDALTDARLDYAICGGFAVAIHGYPRLTRDIDLLIQEHDLVEVRRALAGIGFTLDSGWITFAVGKPDERRLWRVSKAVGPDLITIDLMLVGPFLAETWQGRQRHSLAGRTVSVVSRDGLLQMKRAAGRSKALDDLEQLGLQRGGDDGSR